MLFLFTAMLSLQTQLSLNFTNPKEKNSHCVANYQHYCNQPLGGTVNNKRLCVIFIASSAASSAIQSVCCWNQFVSQEFSLLFLTFVSLLNMNEKLRPPAHFAPNFFPTSTSEWSRDLRVYTVYILYLQITESPPPSYNEKLQKKIDRIRYINIQRIIRSTFDTSANRNKQTKKINVTERRMRLKCAAFGSGGLKWRLNSTSVWPISAND